MGGTSRESTAGLLTPLLRQAARIEPECCASGGEISFAGDEWIRAQVGTHSHIFELSSQFQPAIDARKSSPTRQG